MYENDSQYFEVNLNLYEAELRRLSQARPQLQKKAEIKKAEKKAEKKTPGLIWGYFGTVFL